MVQQGGLLSVVSFAMRETVHTTQCATPMQLVFNCNAIHNVCFEANLQYIKQIDSMLFNSITNVRTLKELHILIK